MNDLQAQRFTEMLGQARSAGVEFEVAHLSNLAIGDGPPRSSVRHGAAGYRGLRSQSYPAVR